MPNEFQRYRVLWPLVPAMAMVMIDFRIVSISATTIQSDLHLSETAVQWLVAYALSTAAFVALGGRLGDIFGHRRIVAGLAVLAYFVSVERKTDDPLIDVNAMIANRPFAVDNLLTFLVFGPWLAVFFFGSMYFQVAVGQEPTQAGFSILAPRCSASATSRPAS